MLRILILACFVGVGALIVAASYKPVASAKEASNWPTTSAIITQSTVERITTKQKKSDGSNRMEDRITFRPSIMFEYSVDGIEHTGTTLSFSQRTYSTTEDAASLLKGYTVGSATPVHYNPDNPQESVVQPAGEPSYLFTYFGTLIIAASAWWIVKPFLKELKDTHLLKRNGFAHRPGSAP